MPRLYVLSGPDVGKHFEVRAGALLGRSAECAVPLRDASVSRLHARLELGADGLEVVDNGSRNGVKVDGRKVPRVLLVDGLEFEVGEVLLRFRVDAAAIVGAEATGIPAPRVPQASIPIATTSAHADPDLGAEIELEGEWSEPAPGVQPRSASPAAAEIGSRPAVEPTRRAPVDSRDPVVSRAPAREADQLLDRPADRSAERRAALGARVPMASAKASVDPTSNRAVLQYHRVDQKEGLLGSDLDQQPLWMKALAAVAAMALFAGIFWLAFRGTSLLRGSSEDPLPAEASADR